MTAEKTKATGADQDLVEDLKVSLPWLVKGFVGLAGLAVYVELVGGAVLWARYRSAHIPEVQTIEALSRPSTCSSLVSPRSLCRS